MYVFIIHVLRIFPDLDQENLLAIYDSGRPAIATQFHQFNTDLSLK